MNEPRPSAHTSAAKRLQLRRRAKRGVVASYIHQLSERHNAGGSRGDHRAEDLIHPAKGG